MKEEIVIVEDEVEIVELLKVYLENEGFEVKSFHNGKEGMEYLSRNEVSLAILDIMLPDMNGFQICKIIREHFFYPIIMLTAKIEPMDKITGLTLGADDYITKPFHPLEVIARVKTQIRRYQKYNHEKDTPDKVVEYDIRGLSINQSTHQVHLYGDILTLTPIEFSILWYLCEKKDNVVSSEELFEAVWGEKFLDNNNTVMAHIGRLRDKLKDSSRTPKFIKTVWGVGYKIES